MVLSLRLPLYEEPLFACSIHAVECDGKRSEKDMKRVVLIYYGREYIDWTITFIAFRMIKSTCYVFRREKISVFSWLMIVCYLCWKREDHYVDIPKRLFLSPPETKPMAFLHLKVEMYVFNEWFENSFLVRLLTCLMICPFISWQAKKISSCLKWEVGSFVCEAQCAYPPYSKLRYFYFHIYFLSCIHVFGGENKHVYCSFVWFSAITAFTRRLYSVRFSV